MADIIHEIGGIEIESPREFDALEISVDYMTGDSEASIDNLSFELAGRTAQQLHNRIWNGLTGGVGIFEGIDYTIKVGGQMGVPAYRFDGILDFTNDLEIIAPNEINVTVKKLHGESWIVDKADAFSFRYLREIGVVTTGDFVKVPYVINYVPDGLALVTIGISIFMVGKEIVNNIKQLAEMAGDTTDASTPVVGTSVGLGAGVVTAWDIGNIILTVLKALAYVAYTIALVIALKNLIEQLIEELCPKKRYHLGMTYKRLFERACQHLGLSLQSSLLDSISDWVVIPTKNHKGGEKPEGFKGTWSETGVPSLGDPFDTFRGLIKTCIEKFRADYAIVGNTFIFEREDWFEQNSTYVVPDVFGNQNSMQDPYRFNTDELFANYMVSWAFDTQDQNTLDNTEGLVCQVIHEPKTIINKDFVTLSKLEEKTIPCSMGLEKSSLTRIEEALKGLAKILDTLTGAFGAGTSYASKIDARKGSLLMSSHTTSMPKVVVMGSSKLKDNQRQRLSARWLWDNFHYISSFADYKGVNNQWLRFKSVKVPFSWKHYNQLDINNYAQTKSGEKAMIERLKWKTGADVAEIDYRVKIKYTDNLKLKIIE